jgi:hypothetical protein
MQLQQKKIRETDKSSTGGVHNDGADNFMFMPIWTMDYQVWHHDTLMTSFSEWNIMKRKF